MDLKRCLSGYLHPLLWKAELRHLPYSPSAYCLEAKTSEGSLFFTQPSCCDSLCCLQVVEELVSNIGVVEKLQNFQYKDAKGKDWGLNVRNRAKELANFVLNPDRVRSERAKV